MACNNCYNGCVDTTSDKCVRYTGLPSEALGIETNDSLFVVEEALINAVVSFLDGTGIDITIDPEAYCELVTQYLPTCVPICSPPTAVELFEALVKAACDLQGQVDVIVADLAELNGDYTIDCLDGVTSSSSTHEILQATINKLCELGVDLAALAIDVDTNYVKLADLNTLIQAYLDSAPSTASYYTKMIPYTAIEYYGDLTGFDITGAGSGIWEKIYLCNGQNGTPDKRGRVPVGVTTGMGGGTFDAAVDPAIFGNPTYTISGVNSKAGTNIITLSSTQVPIHTHSAISVVTDPEHNHFVFNSIAGEETAPSVTALTSANFRHDVETGLSYRVTGSVELPTLGLTTSSATGVTVSTTNGSAGGDGSHANNQPALACYYIMYIP